MTPKRNSFNGPGILIAAAFIGPGTVTMCTLAGATHGLQLLWAVGLSIFITVLFQEMSARLGIISQKDMAALVRQEISHPILKPIITAIILAAIVIGNGAYEAGNISGGALGLNTYFPEGTWNFTPILIGLVAFGLLWMKNTKLLEKSLTLLVGIMSLAFVITAIMTAPSPTLLIKGLCMPSLPDGSLLLVLGVVGTTIVPYNLFLHASLARKHWQSADELSLMRKNTYWSVGIGGLISMAIVITAASLEGQEIHNAVDLAASLKPLFGAGAEYMVSLGLLAAGLTSAITAPLAAAYVMSAVFDRFHSTESWLFRGTWMLILVVGIIFSSIGFKPIAIIRFAQMANGLLLPLIAMVIVWLCNRETVLGQFKNSRIRNLWALSMIVFLILLGLKALQVLG